VRQVSSSLHVSPAAVGARRLSLVDDGRADTTGWERRYARSLVLVDAGALVLAAALALLTRFGGSSTLRGISYYAVAAAVVVFWMAVLALSRCYEPRFLGIGTEEFKRIGNASVRLTAVVALFCYATQLEVARGFLGVALPAGLLLLLAGRAGARARLRQQRREGRSTHRVLAVGGEHHVRELVEQLHREPMAGLAVVGACVPGGAHPVVTSDGASVPVLGSLTTVKAALALCGADTVAVTASAGLNAQALRRLSYDLEGTGVSLLVAPALTNVTGNRISIRPVAGLPLMHVDEPELSGARKVVKALFDRGVALFALSVLAPVLLTLAVLVRLTSPGPAIFRQERVGRGGGLFRVWKFRSMYVDAEARKAELQHLNEHDGVLFKLRDDPRITPLGQVLRKYSLDELPQLINVLRGEMSLVGPRPPLASEVERYEGHAHRRLLVKPGITGLWQVSGRSDLSWDETVRLDLQYVENWSLGLDIVVLAKTVVAVVRGSGAY